MGVPGLKSYDNVIIYHFLVEIKVDSCPQQASQKKQKKKQKKTDMQRDLWHDSHSLPARDAFPVSR